MFKVIRKRILLLFVLPIFFFVSACKHIASKVFLFETEVSVTHRTPIHDLFFPMGMHVHRDYLVLSQVGNPGYALDYFYQAYSLSDLSFVGSFGRRGRGPGEWNNPDIVRSSNMSPYLYLCEVSSRESTAIIHKMTLDTLAQLKEVRTFSIDKGHIPMNRSVIKNDSLLVFDEFMPDQRALRMYHLQGEHPVASMKYSSATSPQHLDENRGILMANDSCIIFIYVHKEMIDFMDWNFSLKKRLNYSAGNPVIPDDFWEQKCYYAASYLGEKFLYALYSGLTQKERREKSHLPLTLEVFDMSGTPVCRYTFSEPTPDIFVVDERTFTLYGYRGSDGMEDYISVYHLPGLKEYLQNR